MSEPEPKLTLTSSGTTSELVTPTSFTFYIFTGMSFWTRLRLGLSLALAPLTILITGRSIKVTIQREQN